MLTIMASDIFGITDELIDLGERINKDTLIIDPYNGEKNLFSNENAAYEHFMRVCGIDAYSRHVTRQITKINTPSQLIGFSVGASAIWKTSPNLCRRHFTNTHLFYGSQIRHESNIEPKIPINLILPKHEENFSINSLSRSLEKTNNTTLQHSKGLHGFMNKLSCNFNQQEYDRYIAYLRESASQATIKH
ncbi:dienelactone hydrolase [Sinobacterium caligoides]|uniref:Dienelactone hydrolase n=1 Tax=Sinobacterium caligoides TaxID=933926 RepID=A0A3N2DKE8_9GAMM|nr:hypothetical protein [Sinobacterium caligoides]ROS00273.1 dienelactone hydrolase [Sinobacterium caligoides]